MAPATLFVKRAIYYFSAQFLTSIGTHLNYRINTGIEPFFVNIRPAQIFSYVWRGILYICLNLHYDTNDLSMLNLKNKSLSKRSAPYFLHRSLFRPDPAEKRISYLSKWFVQPQHLPLQRLKRLQCTPSPVWSPMIPLTLVLWLLCAAGGSTQWCDAMAVSLIAL